jgi:hypothetical protein
MITSAMSLFLLLTLPPPELVVTCLDDGAL